MDEATKLTDEDRAAIMEILRKHELSTMAISLETMAVGEAFLAGKRIGSNAMQDDLAAILRAAGLSDAARPYSAHEVVRRDLLPRLLELAGKRAAQVPQEDPLYVVLCALADANEMCRSAAQIAKRKGGETNWDAFEKQLGASLKRQHIVMHWDQYGLADRQAFLAQFSDAAIAAQQQNQGEVEGEGEGPKMTSAWDDIFFYPPRKKEP